MKFCFQIFTQNKTYVHKKPWIRIVIAALSTIAKHRNVKCLLIGKWISKLWYIHTKEYYLEIKGTSSQYTLQYGTSLKHAEWKKREQSTCVCNSTYMILRTGDTHLWRKTSEHRLLLGGYRPKRTRVLSRMMRVLYLDVGQTSVKIQRMIYFKICPFCCIILHQFKNVGKEEKGSDSALKSGC